MGLFTRRSTPAVDKAAAKAYTRGNPVYVRTVHAMPGRNDGGLASAIASTEAAGWRLEHQDEGVKVQAGYRQRYWTLTFRAVRDLPPAS
ncbi:hypothetical protein ACE1SV_13300 [Streptomyces sennicomposti]